jgi:4-diphosphocytidyl-2-C-methyl-D-erythritol kinase
MEVFAPAKLNLCLDIIARDQSGYHEIQTVLTCTKSHQNRIEIFERTQKQNMGTPNSLAESAVHLTKSTHKIDKNIELKIDRKIPFSSGLGGESSNAAAVLRGLNELWELGLDFDALRALGGRLGCDVPYFIEGGTALCTHYGEVVEKLPHIDLSLGVIPRSSPLKDKTKKAFTAIDLSLCGKHTEKTETLIEALKRGDQKTVIANLHNDFQQLYEIKPGEHLTGAGPSTFKVKRTS